MNARLALGVRPARGPCVALLVRRARRLLRSAGGPLRRVAAAPAAHRRRVPQRGDPARPAVVARRPGPGPGRARRAVRGGGRAPVHRGELAGAVVLLALDGEAPERPALSAPDAWGLSGGAHLVTLQVDPLPAVEPGGGRGAKVRCARVDDAVWPVGCAPCASVHCACAFDGEREAVRYRYVAGRYAGETGFLARPVRSITVLEGRIASDPWAP